MGSVLLIIQRYILFLKVVQFLHKNLNKEPKLHWNLGRYDDMGELGIYTVTPVRITSS